MKACKINASILLGDKCVQSQLVLSFTRADVPRVGSPCIFCGTFLLVSFFLPVVDDDFFGGGESRNLSRVMRRITSVKHHLKGGVQKINPSTPLQAINNDWSLTETFRISKINYYQVHGATSSNFRDKQIQCLPILKTKAHCLSCYSLKGTF